MFSKQIHIDAVNIPCVASNEEIYDNLFSADSMCAVPFTVDTKYNYHPDEEWMKQVSQDLINLGAEEGSLIYIDN